MTDTPEDIRAKAGDAILAGGEVLRCGEKLHMAIAQALMEERERCALIAENCDSFPFEGDHIGKLIRSTP